MWIYYKLIIYLLLYEEQAYSSRNCSHCSYSRYDSLQPSLNWVTKNCLECPSVKFNHNVLSSLMYRLKSSSLCSFCCFDHLGLCYGDVNRRCRYHSWHPMCQSKKTNYWQERLYSLPLPRNQEKRMEMDRMSMMCSWSEYPPYLLLS